MSHALCFTNFPHDPGSTEEPAFIFRFNEDEGSGPELVRDVFTERGMQEFQPEIHREHEWNLWWKGSQFRANNYAQIKPWQRLNHHPKAKGGINDITSKDGLSRNMRRMRGIYNDVFNFTPETFHLPREERLFKDTFRLIEEDESIRRNNIWIYKPAEMSRGRGIFLLNQLGQLRYGTKSVVQRYITNPFLISGYKFDLRLYAVVVSYRPLVVYLLNDGIVRFSTERFDLSSLDNVYSHLTNTSINKFGPSYSTKKVGIGAGCKWSLAQLRYYLYQKEINDRKLWAEIITIINLTILSQAASIPKVANCFELFGFDIMFDTDIKPWLLEVNFSPAMKYDCSVDSQVKKDLVHSICDLLGFSNDDAIGGRHISNTLDQFFEPFSGGPGWTRNRAKTRWEAARAPKAVERRESTQIHPPRKGLVLTTTTSSGRKTSGGSGGGEDDMYTTDSGFSSACSGARPRQNSTSGEGGGSTKREGQQSRPPGGSKKMGKNGRSLRSGKQTGDNHRMDCIAEGSDTEDAPHADSKYRLPSLSPTPGRRHASYSETQLPRCFQGESGSRLQRLRHTSQPSWRPNIRNSFPSTNSGGSGKKGNVRAAGRGLRAVESSGNNTYCGRDDRKREKFERASDTLGCLLGPTDSDGNQQNKLPVNLFYGPSALRRTISMTSHDQIPPLAPSYGSLKLIFPFNRTTRMAAIALDEKSIVRELIRLLRHRSKGLGSDSSGQSGDNTASSTATSATSMTSTSESTTSDLIDIPDVWLPL